MLSTAAGCASHNQHLPWSRACSFRGLAPTIFLGLSFCAASACAFEGTLLRRPLPLLSWKSARTRFFRGLPKGEQMSQLFRIKPPQLHSKDCLQLWFPPRYNHADKTGQLYVSFIGLRLTKTSLTLINRTRLIYIGMAFIIGSNPLHTNLFPILYAFSLFLSEFHSVILFNGNFCEPGRARFAEKKMEFPSQVVSKTYSTLFSAKFGSFSNSFRGRVSINVRNEPVQEMFYVVKCETRIEVQSL